MGTRKEPLSTFIGTRTFSELLDVAKTVAASAQQPWTTGLTVILSAIYNNPKISRGIAASDLEDWIAKWIELYFRGFATRASERVSLATQTVPDPAIAEILHAKLPKLRKTEINQIISNHRLAMSAENILGHILEQYVAEKLEPHGWHACWGQVTKYIDFAHADGTLLQIKNHSNSENSASSSVRDGTKVLKWHRIEAASGETNWASFPIQQVRGSSPISEADFRSFIRAVVERNPGVLSLEDDESDLLHD